MKMQEYVATVRTAKGTQAVTIKGLNVNDATARLLRMGYLEVLSIG